MTNKALLEEFIRRSGIKKHCIADKMGISRSSLALKIANRVEFRASEIDSLSKILNLSIEDRIAVFFAE